MKIFVTGATGFIGYHLVKKLLNHGHQLFCLARINSDHKKLTDLGAQIVPGDLLEPQSFTHSLNQCEMVFHVAGVTKSIDSKGYYSGNQQTTHNLVGAITPPPKTRKRLIFISSQAAAGPSISPLFGDTIMDSTPVSAYGRSKRAAEQEVEQAREKLDYVILRPSVVFGPGDREMLPLFKAALSGIIPHAGFRDFPANFIYIEDLIRAILLAAESDRTTGKTYFVHDGNPSSWKIMNSLIGRQCNHRAVVLPIALPLLMITCHISGMISKIRKKPAYINPDKWHEIKQPGWLCSNRKLQEDTAFSAQWSLSDAVSETAEWYRQQGWIKRGR